VAAASRSPSEGPDAGADAQTTPYLDNLATTPQDPQVLEAMLPFFTSHFGNPSSRTHRFGWDAAAAVDAARGHVASLIGASPREIVFTSGATEANNLAIKGFVDARGAGHGHLVTCVTEHRAVLDVFGTLERRGFRVTRVGVDPTGRIDLDQLERALDDNPLLLSVMAASNEIGTLQPLDEIARRLEGRGVVWHCDAAQAVGKVPIDVADLPIDLLSISAHKMYGPKGQGALFVRRRRPPLSLSPLLEGGGQERGLRSGTLNVPGIVGLGEACRLCADRMQTEATTTAALRDRLEIGLADSVPGLLVNGHTSCRLPGALSVSFPGIDGTDLLLALRDLAVSAGSACTSGSSEPSYVLKAIGRDDTTAAATLRFGIGRFNADADIDYALRRTVEEVVRLRTAAE
jgi:cysteine desulfurase